MTFLELYWGRVSGVMAVPSFATLFSIAVWALGLAPVIWIPLRWLLAAGWLLTTTAAIMYHQFFQDFPSVENLLYANQVGTLGDSIRSLVEQRPLIPALVGGAMVTVLWWPRAQRKIQTEKT
ncbi:MAG: hypothetical protein J6386_16560 [Candidatus Synoicihabitans palmerolidicus]|nr:hypothetical protein [Candidatus Synoicihabitans palmerolidicus]